MSERLSELKQEILLQNGIFPPLTDAEDAALRESISRHGIIEPVLVDDDVRVISGNNRLRISNELNIPCPFLILHGLTDEERREFTIMLNAARRQLNRQQRRKLIEVELMHDAARSDRRIAGICGVAHTTVATVRAEIATAAAQWRALELPIRDAPILPPAAPDTDVEQHSTPIWQRPGPTFTTEPVLAVPRVTDQRGQPVDDRRVDTIGRRQPARRTRRPPIARPIATLTCPCCDTSVELWKTDGAYQLRHP